MKSYISRKFPLETRTTDQTLDFCSAERLIGSNGSQSWPFVTQWRRPPIELHSPQCFLGHAACPLGTAHFIIAPRGTRTLADIFRMSLYTCKDKSAAKLAQWASLAEDRRVASSPPTTGCPSAYQTSFNPS